MKKSSRGRWAALVLGVLVAATPMCLVTTPAHAANADVVLNEFMYHAPENGGPWVNVEFIELHNTGPDPVDVSGWRFSVGITVATVDQKLPTGTIIPAGGYLLGSNDLALFQSRYGFAADFSYAGSSLSNAGELVTLVDSGDAVVDSVLYDDAAPWPVEPDGLGIGPSLEFDGDGLDNALASSWHASSVPFGTPRAANTIPPLPITGVAPSSSSPSPNQPFTVSATAPVGSALTLTYKVMYGADVTIPMADDAASPGGAGDGVYAASVPGAAAGELVRFKVHGTKGSKTGSYPVSGDSRPYDGVVMADPDLGAAQLPVLQWFMSDAVYQDMITNHRCDDVTTNATFAYGGRVLDGGAMRIKGHSTCQDAKAKWDVELPAGYTFDFGAPYEYPLKKFDMQNEAIPRPRLGWEMISQTGQKAPEYQTMRIERNGSFFGVFGILENYDGTFRSNAGYKDAAFYKVEAGGLKTYPSVAELVASLDWDKKNPDDGNYTEVWDLTQKIDAPATPAQAAWIRENFDLPQLANYTAVTVAMRHWDSGTKNYYLARDPKTARWQVFSWDLDGILNGGTDPKGDFVFPSVTNATKLWTALYAMPDFRTMHYRRVRELSDQFLTGTTLIDRFDALTVPYANDLALDRAKWGGSSLSSARSKTVTGIQERRNRIAAHTNATEIPLSQSANPDIVINEIQYHPGTGAAEYVELYNPSATEAVDLSDWTVPAIGYTASPGTVILPKGYLVWTRDDAALKATHGSNFLMAGQYPGALDDAGEEVTLFDGARAVDTVTYAPDGAWPVDANGNGPSLELIDPASDNADPASWAVSIAPTANGTPGARNSVFDDGSPVTSDVFAMGSSWKYLANATTPANTWRDAVFDDSTWTTGTGSFGFRAGQTTQIPQGNRQVTYYFRKSVDIAAGNPIQAATLTLRRDDGAVIYVNGVEVARSNMPAGAISSSTKASTNVNTAGIGTTHTLTIPASALSTGTNVVAVEVHQFAPGSTSDLFFDLGLQITR